MKKRNPLEDTLFAIADQWVDSKNSGLLTSTTMAHLASDELGRDVSAGTVSNTLKRWKVQQIAVIHSEPLRFVCYTHEVTTVGIEALKRRHRKPYASCSQA